MIIKPKVEERILIEAGEAIQIALSEMDDVAERNEGIRERAKFELLYIQQQLAMDAVKVPMKLYQESPLANLVYARGEEVFPTQKERDAVGVVLSCLRRAERVRQKTDALLVAQIIDYFIADFCSLRPADSDAIDASFIADLVIIRNKVIAGETALPIRTKDFPNYERGSFMNRRAREKKSLRENFSRLKFCLETRFLPLMPWDTIEGEEFVLYS